MKGWYGNKQRHSLASKGVRSKQVKYSANGKYNYYEQLEPIVLPYLTHFQNDFLVHDKKIFDGDVNEFIYGIRDSGTDIIQFKFNEDMTPEQREAYVSWVTRDTNDRFFYGKDGIITEVSREEAENLYLDYVKKSEKQRKVKITDFNIEKEEVILKQAIDEITKRQYYGMRDEKVIPKKRYTVASWSNAGAEWILYEKVPHENTLKLDANEIVLPFRLEQVEEIERVLPPLPLYVYSYEAKNMYSVNDQESINEAWAVKQVESRIQDKSINEKERMEWTTLLLKYKMLNGKDKMEDLL